MSMRTAFALVLFCLATIAPAQTEPYLAPLSNGYGPFDYSDPVMRQEKLDVVHKYHFDEGVRSLTRGMNSSVWADLNYVVRAFPNHHMALEAMGRLLRMRDTRMPRQLRDERYRGMPPEVEADAYFKRAIEFAPHDGVAPLLYGIHLHKTDRIEQAVEQYKEAARLGVRSADLEYNLGLAYIELEQYDKAVQHAKKAYQLGHPLPGLRNKLTEAGVWETRAAAEDDGSGQP